MSQKNKILYLSGINNNKKYGYYNAIYNRALILKSTTNLSINFVSIPIIDSFFLKILKKILRKSPNVTPIKEQSIFKYYPYKKTIISSIINLFKKDYIENQIYKIITTLHHKNNYTFVHAHWAYPYGYLAYKLYVEENIPYVINIHGSDIHTHPYRNKSIMKKTILVLNHAKHVYGVSESLINEAKQFHGITQNIFTSTFNGVFIPSKDKLLINYNKKHIAFIGILSYQKGADYLIPIYKQLKLHQLDVQMSIIGNGELYQSIKKNIQKYKLNINLLNFKSSKEIEVLKQEFDLIIMPSRVEGFGMIALESYAFNIPVIASNVGGLKELIIDKEYLINSNQNIINEFVKKISYFYNNKQNRSDFKYYEYAKKYEWEKIVKIESKEYIYD